MNERLINANLVCDNSTLAALGAEVSALGEIMVCCGCSDIAALIEGVLVLKETEEAWPLCGECLRRLPLAGMIV